MREAPVERAPLIVCVCVIAVMAAAAWLLMFFVVVGIAMLVSMAGGDIVEWLIRWPAIVLLAAWLTGMVAYRLTRRTSGGGDAG